MATMLLLMNSVLPHHHHHEEVCFTSSHCSEEDSDHHGNDLGHSGVNHNHHSQEADYCEIINYYLTPNGKNLTAKTKFKSLDRNVYFNANANSVTIALVFYDHSPENIFIRNKVGLNAKCLTRSLRAPPYC